MRERSGSLMIFLMMKMNILIKDIDFPKRGYIDVRLFADGRATTQEGAEMSYRELRVSKASPCEGKWKKKAEMIRQVLKKNGVKAT